MWQQLIIVGNVGQQPELRFIQDGTAVCNFSLAVNERWVRNGEKQERTTWFRVTAWRQLGETVNQYVQKGQQVMVVGTVSARGYVTNRGEPAASLDVTARDVRFLGKKESTDHPEQSPEGGWEPMGDEENIPF